MSQKLNEGTLNLGQRTFILDLMSAEDLGEIYDENGYLDLPTIGKIASPELYDFIKDMQTKNIASCNKEIIVNIRYLCHGVKVDSLIPCVPMEFESDCVLTCGCLPLFNTIAVSGEFLVVTKH